MLVSLARWATIAKRICGQCPPVLGRVGFGTDGWWKSGDGAAPSGAGSGLASTGRVHVLERPKRPARVRGKRARYAAEPAEAAVGKPATRFVARAWG
jgi:hypothetical protein